MEQSETAAVARQLDFAASCKASGTTNANGKGNSILPEHPQAQLQSKLLALAPSRQFHASSRLPQQVAQTKIPSTGPKRIRSLSKSPPREIASTGRQKKSLPILLPRAHPVKLVSLPKSALQPLQNTESPKTRALCHLDMKDCTPKKQKHLDFGVKMYVAENLVNKEEDNGLNHDEDVFEPVNMDEMGNNEEVLAPLIVDESNSSEKDDEPI
ncbi:uncharacterized protein LOC142545080 [Primulina tabacum]|uniref:uncharacterized protein LOC142545080 n=1 Tax=Primulina tabacum TaxID=48773 RepID=UPI003F59CE8E